MINTNILQTGAQVFVESQRANYYLLKGSNIPADGVNVVVASGTFPGRWIRQDLNASATTALHSNWYIDPNNGDDSNGGETAAAALATMGELQSRINGTYINQPTTVHLLNDVPESDAFAPVLRLGPLGDLKIRGEGTTVLAATTLTAAQPPVPSTNTRESVTSAGFDWTPYIGSRLRVTNGALVGAVSWLQKLGGSNDEVFVNKPMVPETYLSVTFAGDENVVVERLTKIGKVSVAGISSDRLVLTTGGPLVFEDIDIDQNATGNENLELRIQTAFFGCSINSAYILMEAGGYIVGCKTQTKGALARGPFNEVWGGTMVQDGAGGFFNGGRWNLVRSPSFLGQLTIEGARVQCNTNLGVWDWTGNIAGVRLLEWSSLTVTSSGSRIWGNTDSGSPNSFGFLLTRFAQVVYRAGTTLPTIAGALVGTKDWSVNNHSGTYSQLPFVSPDSSGAAFITEFP